jgi:hypothetical protein
VAADLIVREKAPKAGKLNAVDGANAQVAMKCAFCAAAAVLLAAMGCSAHAISAP